VEQQELADNEIRTLKYEASLLLVNWDKHMLLDILGSACDQKCNLLVVKKPRVHVISNACHSGSSRGPSGVFGLVITL
jgi:hypothetical protein